MSGESESPADPKMINMYFDRVKSSSRHCQLPIDKMYFESIKVRKAGSLVSYDPKMINMYFEYIGIQKFRITGWAKVIDMYSVCMENQAVDIALFGPKMIDMNLEGILLISVPTSHGSPPRLV
jgi:hypothetical protein